MSFDVAYTKKTIDVDATITGSSNDTQGGLWATYSYSGADQAVTTNIVGGGVKTVYDGVDAVVDPTVGIVITVNVDNAHITLPAVYDAGSSKGTKIVLTTDKVGWYNSATMVISDTDITVDVVEVEVE